MLCDVFDFMVTSKTLHFYSSPVEFLGCGISPTTCLYLHRETQKKANVLVHPRLKRNLQLRFRCSMRHEPTPFCVYFYWERYRQVWRHWASNWRLYEHQRSFQKIDAFGSVTVNNTSSALLYHKIRDKYRDNEKNQLAIA